LTSLEPVSFSRKTLFHGISKKESNEEAFGFLKVNKMDTFLKEEIYFTEMYKKTKPTAGFSTKSSGSIAALKNKVNIFII